jgi:hypothetical protein
MLVVTCLLFILIPEKTQVTTIPYCKKGSGDARKSKLLEWTAGCQTRSRFDREENQRDFVWSPWTRLEPNEAYRYVGTLLGVAANILGVGDVGYQIGRPEKELGLSRVSYLLLSMER